MPFITQGKTNLKYILIVIILAVIVGGGILGYYYSWIAELDTRLAELELRLPEVKAPEILPKEVLADETANWKTYTNTELGFSIEYPPEWLVYDNKIPPCTGILGSFVFINETRLEHCIFADVAPAEVIIHMGLIPEVPPYGPLPQSTKYDIYTPFEFAGEKGVINIRTEISAGPRRKDTVIVVNYGGNQYSISYPNTDYQGNHDLIYDQILSTFRFIEKTTVNPAENIINPEFTEYFNTILEANPELKFTEKETKQIIYGEETIFPSPPSNKEDPKWIFSSDEIKAISIFGYFGEPDSRLDVYNRNNSGMVENLKICGTPCSYWIAFWLNNNQFIFIQSVILNHYPALYISLYDLAKNTETIYKSEELEGLTIPEDPEWLKERINIIQKELFGT